MKKVIIILSIILIFLFLLIVYLPSLFKKNSNQQSNGFNFFSKPTTNLQKTKTTISPTQAPTFYNQDFNVEYSNTDKKYVVTKKTDVADEKIQLWLEQNNLKQEDIRVVEDLPQGSEQIIDKSTGGQKKYFEKETKIIDGFLEVLFSIGKISSSTANLPSPSPFPISTGQPIPPTGYKYYAQCKGSFDDYSLPQGCNICKAGCGPTTVSMVLSSYIDKKYNPATVVDIYKQKGFYAGCDGSSYSDAKALFNQMGLKTTDYLVYDNKTINEVADDFKNYLKNGWTLFTLARYCDTGCGHFFWITDIDENNNVWAYDPYYGRLTKPPFNENYYYPFPKYRVVFGVKKI